MIYEFFMSPTVCYICRLLRQLLWKLLPFIVGILLLMVAHEVERRYFPVVKDFKILEVKRTAEGILVQGTLRKVRDCEFVQVSVYANDIQPIKVTFKDVDENSTTKTREVGFQLWGPWELLSGNFAHLDIYARHRCHLLWQQSAKILDLTIPSTVLLQKVQP